MKFFYDPGGWPVTAELNIFFSFSIISFMLDGGEFWGLSQVLEQELE